VPRDRSAEAVLALHERGYDARVTDQEPRDEHPGFVVIRTKRHFAAEDGGRQNFEELKAALSDEGVPHHLYSHSGASVGGSSVHKWSDVFTVDGRPIGLKVLTATPSDVEAQLSTIAEIIGVERDLLMVDPPEYSLARLRPESQHEIRDRTDDEYRQAQAGVEGSIDRFEDARRSGEVRAVGAALAEVLTWTVALDDWHARSFRPRDDGGPSYQALRGEIDQLQWIPAARWARNRALHDLSPLIEVTDGAERPTPWPVVWMEHRWKDRAELPPAGPRYRADPVGETAYDRHAGEPVRHLIYAVRLLLCDEVWRIHGE
jgi:hypothetical protein